MPRAFDDLQKRESMRLNGMIREARDYHERNAAVRDLVPMY